MAVLTTDQREGAAALAAEFSWRIDHQVGEGVSALFTPDGTYGYQGFEMQGTAAIDAFYRERRLRGKRLSRHLFSQQRLVLEDDGSISAWSTLTLHGADGGPPHPAGPIAIMDYLDQIVCAGGEYRFARRWVTLLFGQMPHLVAAQKTGKD